LFFDVVFSEMGPSKALLVLYNVVTVVVCVSFANSGFDDSVMFRINWPGKDFDLNNIKEGDETIIMTSSDNEKFSCVIPSLKEDKKDTEETYEGPGPMELLSPLYLVNKCVIKIEAYWTYEICHGKHIRQYHEERESKTLKLQEYILGTWNGLSPATHDADPQKPKENAKQVNPPIKKLDGANLPYFQLNYTDGTVCDLNGKPRQTSVLYVCYVLGKNDIYSIKETSTCEYEVIILSPLLCSHPKYRPQESGENDINCVPLNDAPTKPQGLSRIESDSLKQRAFRYVSDSKNEKMFAVSIDEFKDKDGTMQVRMELRPMDSDEVLAAEQETPADASPPVPQHTVTPVNPKNLAIPLPVHSFLRGKDCIDGGSGWWKYKFCYGVSVEQYHIEKVLDGKLHKHSIALGYFDKDTHIEWLQKNPKKRPKPLASRTYISHYYSGGDVCDEIGSPRETEVKLKCVKDQGTVSIYLLEPNVCQYILGIESPLICKFIDKVDENGLVDLDLLEE